MNIRKLPLVSFAISWPPPAERRSSLGWWAMGLGVAVGAAITAYGMQRVRSAMADATMRHDHHGKNNAQRDDRHAVDPSG